MGDNSIRIILISPGASGKDYLKNKMIQRGFRYSVSYTTRPPRDGEIEGVDYYFIDKATFLKMVENGEMREYNCFGEMEWYYGTSKKEFEQSNLFIMTPSAIRQLTPEERQKHFVIFLDIPEEIRLERLKARKDADDPIRRIITDRELFAGFKDYDLRITTPDF